MSTTTTAIPMGSVPIAKLPSARRYTSEVRENMNCKSCRKRKIKCSRTRPSCNACDVFRCECVYDAVPKKRGPKTEVLEELLKRIDGLEKRLGEKSASNSPSEDSRVPDYRISPPPPPPPPPRADVLSPPVASAPSLQQDDYTRLIPKLVDVFFERVNGKPYFFFHEATFRATRQQDSVVNAVCAATVRYLPAPLLCGISAQQHAESFAGLARAQVDADEPTLENLQTMLLLSLTYYAMGYGKKAFMQMGSAIRMTLALDLHRELPHFNPASPLQREIRRRVFWACYLMDRFTVCGTCRPPQLSDRSIELRLPCSDASFASGTPGEAVFFSQSGSYSNSNPPNSNLLVDVVRMLGNTIQYTQSGGVKGDSHFPWHTASNLSRIRAELNMWASTRDLRDGIPATPDATSLFLARAVWHVIHCLMYRNFLPIDLSELDGAGTQQAWQMEATKVCFQHANALVDLITVAEMTPSIEWPAFAGFALTITATVLVHGVFYRGSDAFRKCRESLGKVIRKIEELKATWACMSQHLFTLRKLYNAHEHLVSHSPRVSVFHLDDFFARYEPAGAFEAAHIPFFAAPNEDCEFAVEEEPQHHMQLETVDHEVDFAYNNDYPFSPPSMGNVFRLALWDTCDEGAMPVAAVVEEHAGDEGDPLLGLLAEMAERDGGAHGDANWR